MQRAIDTITKIALVLVMLAVAGVFTPAAAQSYCAPHAEIVSKLLKSHAEKSRGMGLASNGTVVEILVSPSGSWTILTTRPDGWSCFVGVGLNWRDADTRPSTQGEEL